MKKILIAHDGSKASNKALRLATEMAVRFGSELYVLSVVPELYLTEISDIDKKAIEDALSTETNKLLQKVEKKLSAKNIPYRCIINQGEPAEEILNTAKSLRVNLIVTGSHGRRGPSRFLLGSVSSRIVEHAHCPVLVVK
jgi:nucleotide-binding universal stress UspA family protein